MPMRLLALLPSLPAIALSAALLAGAPGSGLAAAEADADLALLRQRIVSDLLSAPPPSVAVVEGWLATLTPVGRWPDIDYRSQQRSNWLTAEHTARLARLALAWADGASPLHGDARLVAAAARAIDGWFSDEPTGPNWWSNEIGVPLQLAQALLLFGDALPAVGRARPLPALRRSWVGPAAAGTRTGQNLVWRGTIALQLACLTGDDALADEALAGITSTLAVSAEEGIQADGSFHQHGPQLYAAGYGMGTSDGGARLAEDCHGTRFAFSQQRLDSLASLVLDGQQWFMQHGYFDHGAMGRELARVGATAKGRIVSDIARRLAHTDPARAADYAACAARALDAPDAVPLRGTKVFWRSDFIVHHRPGWYASVKWESLRTVGSELVNGENLHGRHLADGLACTWRRGDEYVGVYPLWDWCQLPGTTAARTTRQPGGAKGRGSTAFAGGISDGTAGGVGFDFAKDGVTAHKAWFLADEEILCLGAGIASAGLDPIVTTIDQRPLHGVVQAATIGTADAPPADVPGALSVAGPAWILHDGTGYLVPGAGQHLALRQDQRTDAWQSINAERRAPPVTMQVLSLGLEHGTQPDGASYHYIVVPGTTAAGMTAYAVHPAVQVLVNTPALQAAWCARQHTGFAALYAPGMVDFPAGPAITAAQPCLLLLRLDGADLVLSVSDPTQQLVALTLTTPMRVEGAGATWDAAAERTTITVALPSGLQAGRTATSRFNRR